MTKHIDGFFKCVRILPTWEKIEQLSSLPRYADYHHVTITILVRQSLVMNNPSGGKFSTSGVVVPLKGFVWETAKAWVPSREKVKNALVLDGVLE